ncbi:MAG TPA: serine/threonine protein phosphatase [Spirochaetales bacterium]|nr:serine/threonine protein phosphatase [Spirochaetales bacterium]HRY53199.1 serine/threonine protein phosphatase [Spirochaetia bacterium]HRZ64154.1 serine/threonine protein phosphatase [Spirochaetia bacterium]
MKFPEFLSFMDRLAAASPRERLGEGERILVLSDLHMGNGGSRDDLRHNRELLVSSLSRYYLERGWKLVLNGDIEELSKFELPGIREAWGELYELFGAFHERGLLRKIVGNHDLRLELERGYPWPVLPSLLLEWREGRRLLLFHGHQATGFYLKYDRVQDFLLRWLARPLGIRNRSASRDPRKRVAAERRIYRAARMRGLIAVVGHTHRPLFESLGKRDSLRFAIERLLDDYARAEEWLKPDIRELIEVYRGELERMRRKEARQEPSLSSCERGGLLVPCYFNSGTAIGKHGYTALELEGSSISLVLWAGSPARDYIEREALQREELEGGPFARYVLKRDGLGRVFDRIELLSGPLGPEAAR